MAVRTRSREVVREARNGGEPCPPVQESAGCAEYWDQHRQCRNSLGEILSSSSTK